MDHMKLATSIFRALLIRIFRVSVDLDLGSNRVPLMNGVVEGNDKKVLCQALNNRFLPLETDNDDKVRTL